MPEGETSPTTAVGSASGSEYEGDAIRRFQNRVLRAITLLAIFAFTPVMVFTQISEYRAGRFGGLLVGHLVVHVLGCVGLVAVRQTHRRAAILIVYMLAMNTVTLLNYGPNINAGLVFAGILLVGEVYFGRIGAIVCIGLMIVTVAVVGALFASGSIGFDLVLVDPTKPGLWVRIVATSVVLLLGIGALLRFALDSFATSARQAREALARERRERQEREAAIEARRAAERALTAAQRHEVVGRLASGAAHDLNNILTAIMVSTEMAALDADDPAAVRTELENVTGAAERASALSRQLLTFSRRTLGDISRVDVGKLIRELDKLIRRLLPSSIELEIEVTPELPEVSADPAQIEQVVLNLCINARDAMPDGGRLTVSAYPRNNEVDRAGVVFEVADQGPGIPEGFGEEIFTPFFTTKAEGKGTGLGLATVKMIVEELEGRVTFTSTPGAGAEFHVWLPAAAPEQVAELAPSPQRATGGNERILVVDDDAAVRHLATRILSAEGYSVYEAENGREAIRQMQDHPIDLLLLDLVMPEMGGVALLEHVQAGALPLVLFCTGYAADQLASNPSLADIPVLRKPYNRRRLLDAVRAVLDTAI